MLGTLGLQHKVALEVVAEAVATFEIMEIEVDHGVQGLVVDRGSPVQMDSGKATSTDKAKAILALNPLTFQSQAGLASPNRVSRTGE